jgi:phosphate transport system ATP-binding protein
MNDSIDGVKIKGDILLDGKSIYVNNIKVNELRRKVGMVFQRPNPFPMSIADNILYGINIDPNKKKIPREAVLEKCLKSAWLWDDLKDKLNESALDLPLYQQQRLCIARLLAVEPEIILMDEPCSALDPISTMKIEELMIELKKNYNIIIVTHNMQQAARISDECGYMLLGELIEYGRTSDIYTNPQDKRTLDYITGRYG